MVSDLDFVLITVKKGQGTADNTAYTLQANALALRDIAPFGHNVVYAGTVSRNFGKQQMRG